MLSKLPTNIDKLGKHERDNEILRAAIIAELDAVSLYEQLAAMTEDKNLKIVLLDIAKEEKVHVGEFQALLLKKDKEQAQALITGQAETEELTK